MYRADIMAAGRDESYEWMWEYFNKLINNRIKCKYCGRYMRIYENSYSKKIRYYNKHGIYNEEELR